MDSFKATNEARQRQIDKQTRCLFKYASAKAHRQKQKNPTWTIDFMDHQSDVSRLWEHAAFRAAKPRQSSKSPLTWRVLPNDIMQTLKVLVLPPTFFKASLWEPWQQSVGHPIETRWTLCLLSEPQTQNVTLGLSLWCVVYTGRKGKWFWACWTGYCETRIKGCVS